MYGVLISSMEINTPNRTEYDEKITMQREARSRTAPLFNRTL